MTKDGVVVSGSAVVVDLCTDSRAWDSYVSAHVPQSYYHGWKWREAIRQTFGHSPYYLAARTSESICGVLPLFHIKSTLFGGSLVSVPFVSTGGVLADNPIARDLLLAKAAELGRRLGVRHIELRQGECLSTDWADRSSKVSMRIDLPPSVDTLWRGLSTGMRNKVRNGQKRGLRAVWGGAEQLGPFYSRRFSEGSYPVRWRSGCCECVFDRAWQHIGTALVGFPAGVPEEVHTPDAVLDIPGVGRRARL